MKKNGLPGNSPFAGEAVFYADFTLYIYADVFTDCQPGSVVRGLGILLLLFRQFFRPQNLPQNLADRRFWSIFLNSTILGTL